MKPKSYSRLLNFAWYQLLWFIAVLGKAPALPLLVLLLVLHLLLARHWAGELALMLAAALLGSCFDLALTLAGFYRFEDSASLLPVWLPTIWMGFAGTLRYSMAFMVARPRLMVAAAVIFAPLTYLAAARLGAVNFPFGAPATSVVIALCWWVITPLLLRLEKLTREPTRAALHLNLFSIRVTER
ncbi:MAG: DUF2878 domain-containing protein [Halieaceae bacterium]|jgi:hypothetical protein|nr:DUF2878 domain-containing protein [Halieaceae bacterium]